MGVRNYMALGGGGKTGDCCLVILRVLTPSGFKDPVLLEYSCYVRVKRVTVHYSAIRVYEAYLRSPDATLHKLEALTQ